LININRIGNEFTIYPITYKEKQYIINYDIGLLSEHVTIYECRDKKHWFFGYRGEKIYSSKSIPCTNGMTPNALTDSICSREEFELNIKEITEAVFIDMEKKQMDEICKEQKMKEVNLWDGVVKL